MKIAISSNGKNLESEVSEVFGRCPYFIVVDISSEGGEGNKIGNIEALKNESLGQRSGAGIVAAQMLAEKGINTVIAKNVGPRASDILNQFNIGIFAGDGTVETVLKKYINQNLIK